MPGEENRMTFNPRASTWVESWGVAASYRYSCMPKGVKARRAFSGSILEKLNFSEIANTCAQASLKLVIDYWPGTGGVLSILSPEVLGSMVFALVDPKIIRLTGPME